MILMLEIVLDKNFKFQLLRFFLFFIPISDRVLHCSQEYTTKYFQKFKSLIYFRPASLLLQMY